MLLHNNYEILGGRAIKILYALLIVKNSINPTNESNVYQSVDF